MAHSTPPGSPASTAARPNSTEMVRASWEDTPTYPSATTMAPSRTPQPAMEMGRVVIRMMGGTSTRQCHSASGIPRPWAST